MAVKKYTKVHTAIFILQFVLILLGLGLSVYEGITHTGRFNDGDIANNMSSHWLNVIVYLTFIVYAVYGYKKGPVFFNACIFMTFLLIYTKFTRATALIDAGLEMTYSTMITGVVVMVLLGVYALTYKKHDKFASVIGILMVLVTLAQSIMLSIFVINKDAAILWEATPFVNLVAISTLVLIHEVRNHWRAHEKAVESFENGESIGVND